jgi:NAD(P)-dependent dehydrogenase (short-subunit alcohol dehydrogenase family)
MQTGSKDTRKVLAVTGAAQGIGRGIALHFAQRGYAISFIDLDEDAAQKAAAAMRAICPEVVTLTGDIAQEPDVQRWMDRTVTELGCPDVLVNNAGIAKNGPFLELKAEDFDRVIAVNVRGTMLCTQAAARRMIDAKRRGTVVNIASTRAFMSEPDTEAYSASKGAIVALTHATAMSLSSHRIRVNCISPGWIETPRVPAKTTEDREQHPVGRVGQPEDIAQACMFLAEHAGFVTGQNLIVDGGMSVKMIYEE